MAEPCTWPVNRACIDERADSTVLASSVDAAVAVLWALTGRRFGVCTTVARPCPRPAETAVTFHGPWMVPMLDSGVWTNIGCTPTTGCSRVGEGVVLLPGPVHEIVGVAVDGVKIDSDSYRLEGDWLYRTEGDWPSQNLSLPLGAEGTWSVTYLRGTPPPAGADLMVGRLANEFVQSCLDPDRCDLPAGTKTIQRQGVTIEIADSAQIIAAGGVGIPEVDMWINAHNPHGLSEPTQVWSPDVEVQ